jgi:F0F1-type ATP synthase delta subunit
MRYSPSQYAEALYDALLDKTRDAYSTTVKHFLYILRKNKDYQALPVILSRFEKVYLKKKNLRKVDITSASKLSTEVHDEIQKIMGEDIVIEEKIKPELLAGLTLLVDDTLYIDASAKTRIARLFS